MAEELVAPLNVRGNLRTSPLKRNVVATTRRERTVTLNREPNEYL
jgi:hypothetical protein